MDSAEPIPQANMRIQAAQTILDRVGLGKTDRLDVTVNTDWWVVYTARKARDSHRRKL